MNYSEKLRDPRWQKKRLDILNRENFTCQLCKDDDTEMHVHHLSYDRGKEPWEYEDENFQALCKYCHKISECLKRDAVVLSVLKHRVESDREVYYVLILTQRESGYQQLMVGVVSDDHFTWCASFPPSWVASMLYNNPEPKYVPQDGEPF